MSLELPGWNPRVAEALAALDDTTLTPARVAREDRDRYLLLTPAGECPAVLAGRLRHAARRRSDLPAVGDWVAARLHSGSDAVVTAVLPRAGAFVRHGAGETTDEQVVAANVDTVFVVAGLDGDFNPRRIERYLAAAWDSGAVPVVVLNKADVAEDPLSRVAEVESVAPGVPVVAVSALDRSGLDALAPYLRPGTTVALLGSSGVGKSTLVNALLEAPRQATQAVRSDDSRGRHTTARRELVPLPGGAVLLDTPGMRELQLWGEGEGFEAAFSDVAELAARCRFGDCAHGAEPGCAVRAAVAAGELAAERLASWHKLQRELRYLATRRDARARADEQAKWKLIAKSMKMHPKSHRSR